MHDRYLEVTFRKGKAIAAYLYLSRQSGAKSTRTRPIGQGLVVDYGLGDRLLGVELTAPSQVTLEDVNQVLRDHGLELLTTEELSPLRAA